MKRKLVVALLTLSMVGTLMTGCGDKSNAGEPNNAKIESENDDSTETESEDEDKDENVNENGSDEPTGSMSEDEAQSYYEENLGSILDNSLKSAQMNTKIGDTDFGVAYMDNGKSYMDYAVTEDGKLHMKIAIDDTNMYMWFMGEWLSCSLDSNDADSAVSMTGNDLQSFTGDSIKDITVLEVDGSDVIMDVVLNEDGGVENSYMFTVNGDKLVSIYSADEDTTMTFSELENNDFMPVEYREVPEEELLSYLMALMFMAADPDSLTDEAVEAIMTGEGAEELMEQLQSDVLTGALEDAPVNEERTREFVEFDDNESVVEEPAADVVE